jgi:hypothetical protein
MVTPDVVGHIDPGYRSRYVRFRDPRFSIPDRLAPVRDARRHLRRRPSWLARSPADMLTAAGNRATPLRVRSGAVSADVLDPFLP